MTKSNLKLNPGQLIGMVARDLEPAPLPDAIWYLAEAVDDGLLYRFPMGALAGANYLTADTLLDGSHLAVFQIILQEGEDGPAFAFSYGLINLYGALTHAMRARRWADVIALGRALDPYLCLRGLWDSWNTVLGYVLDAARQTNDPATQAWALHQQGTRLIGLGDPAQAVLLLKQALEIRKRLGDANAGAYTQHNIDLLLPSLPKGTTGQLSKPGTTGALNKV